MLRPFLAGGLMLGLASAGSSQPVSPADDALSPVEIISKRANQSVSPADDALSPAEIISNLAKPRGASETRKAPKLGAQPGAKDAAKKLEATAKPDAGKKSDATANKREADGLEQCLNDWDRGTHMTRAEWARTCRRVVTNRARFLREQQGK